MKKNKAILYLIIMLIVVGAAYLFSQNRNLFAFSDYSKTVYSVESQSDVKTDNSQGRLVVLNHDGITAISKSGSEQYVIVKPLSTPAMNNNGKYTLLYDRGGRDLSVYVGNKKLFDYKSDMNIKLAKINSAGYVALVSDDSGYKQRVLIIDQHGEVVYKWQIGDSFISDIDISPNCKIIAASTISSEGEVASGRIIFIDIDNEKILSQTVRNNSIFVSLKFIKNSAVIAIGESEMMAVDSMGKIKWTVNYDERIMKGFSFSSNGNPILAMSGTRNNTSLEIYNNLGKKTGEYVSESEIKSFDCYSGVIAICEKRDIKLLGYNGSVKVKKTMPKDIRSIKLIDKHDIAIETASNIEITRL